MYSSYPHMQIILRGSSGLLTNKFYVQKVQYYGEVSYNLLGIRAYSNRRELHELLGCTEPVPLVLLSYFDAVVCSQHFSPGC